MERVQRTPRERHENATRWQGGRFCWRRRALQARSYSQSLSLSSTCWFASRLLAMRRYLHTVGWVVCKDPCAMFAAPELKTVFLRSAALHVHFLFSCCQRGGRWSLACWPHLQHALRNPSVLCLSLSSRRNVWPMMLRVKGRTLQRAIIIQPASPHVAVRAYRARTCASRRQI